MKKLILLSLVLAVAAPAAMAAMGGMKAAPGKAQTGKPYVDKMLQVPEVKAAQEKVWDARLALYGAKHDRNIVGINYHKAEVEKNNPPNKAELLKKLDEARVNADKAYDLNKQLVAAERAQDWEKVKTLHQELAKLRMQARPGMKGGRPGMKGGPGAGGAGQMGNWGDEGME